MRTLLLALVAWLVVGIASNAQTTDPNIMRAEQAFQWLLTDQADSIYMHMADQVKSMVTADQLRGVITQTEAMGGKYQSHSEWEVQDIMGQKAYVTIATFERLQLGTLIVFDGVGNMLGINMVPADMVKKK